MIRRYWYHLKANPNAELGLMILLLLIVASCLPAPVAP